MGVVSCLDDGERPDSGRMVDDCFFLLDMRERERSAYKSE